MAAARNGPTPMNHIRVSLEQWASVPSRLVGAVTQALAKDTTEDLKDLSQLTLQYKPSRSVEAHLSSRTLGNLAQRTKSAGQKVHTQKLMLLKTYLEFIKNYKASGRTGTDPIVGIRIKERLFEDILLYILMNSNKEHLKDEIRNALLSTGATPNLNSQNESVGMLGWKRPVVLLPAKLADALNEIVRSEPALAAKYFLAPGQGVRENAQMPIIKDSDLADTEEEYDTVLAPALNLAMGPGGILEKRGDRLREMLAEYPTAKIEAARIRGFGSKEEETEAEDDEDEAEVEAAAIVANVARAAEANANANANKNNNNSSNASLPAMTNAEGEAERSNVMNSLLALVAAAEQLNNAPAAAAPAPAQGIKRPRTNNNLQGKENVPTVGGRRRNTKKAKKTRKAPKKASKKTKKVSKRR